MSQFGSSLANHLASSLGVSVADATDALNSYLNESGEGDVNPTPPKTKKSTKEQPTKTKNEPPKASESTKNSAKAKAAKPGEKHSCERVKRGATEPCGKNAIRSIGTGKQQKWYCGSEKSGCYQSEINAAARLKTEQKNITENTSAKGVKKAADTKKVSAKTNEDRKQQSDNKSKSLVHDIIGNKLTVAKRVIDNKQIFYEKSRMLAYDNDKKEFFGKYSDKFKTVSPMSDEDSKWIESNGYTVRPPLNAKMQDKHKSRDKVPENSTKSANSVKSANSTNNATKKDGKPNQTTQIKKVPEATVESANSSVEEDSQEDSQDAEEEVNTSNEEISELSNDDDTGDSSISVQDDDSSKQEISEDTD